MDCSLREVSIGLRAMAEARAVGLDIVDLVQERVIMVQCPVSMLGSLVMLGQTEYSRIREQHYQRPDFAQLCDEY